MGFRQNSLRSAENVAAESWGGRWTRTANAFYVRSGILAAAMLLAPLVSMGDVVTEWNERAVVCTIQARQLPFVATRSMAMVHTAVFDAVNSIEGHYTPYKTKVAAPQGSSAEATAVAAAHEVLLKLFPEKRDDLDAAYSASLAQIPEGSGKSVGVTVGEKVAGEIVSLRASDGANATNVYRPTTTPGGYIATTMPIGTTWGSVTPWALEHSSQFRPSPPPPLTSSEWASDYNEIKDLGGKKSTSRTPEQSDITRFWAITGPSSWDPLVRQLASAPGRSARKRAFVCPCRNGRSRRLHRGF